MKKILLFCLVFAFGFSMLGQQALPSKALINKAVKAEYKAPVESYSVFNNEVNYTTRGTATSPSEHIIGTTWYDFWTNGSVNNRFYRYDDGRMAGVFTMGFEATAFPGRGTGYNYYNGTEWSPNPTTRIETVRTGWPSYSPIGESGEIVLCHNYPTNLVYNTRETVGSGSWSELTYLGSTGPPSLAWPRMVVSGPDMMDVHMVANSYDPYMGMEAAVVYSHSPDGGDSWDIENVFLDGMGPDDYLDIGADQYVFAYPQGNTIAFLVGGTWYDLFIMKSTDNGDTWEKIVVWENPYPFFDWNVTITDTFFCIDNSANITLDADGKCHVVFGLHRVLHNEVGTSYFLYPYVDGIGYWNEDMEPFSNDVDALAPPQYGYAHSEMVEDYNYIGWMQDVDGDGEVTLNTDIFYYGWQRGPSGMPTITVDDQGRRFVIFASTTETYENDVYNYKHLWARGYENGIWGEFLDLSGDITHIFDECIYPVLAHTSDENIHYIYQADITPGCAVMDNHAYQENFVYYGQLPKSDLLTGIEDELTQTNNLTVEQNYPNPFTNNTNIKVRLEQPGTLMVEVVNVTGQKVMSVNKGYLAAGTHFVKLDASKLDAGVYFYTVINGTDQVTRSMIVE
ncbi:MAG: T9SS type A sorting domain-containing protein [Bacteroidetes bacterium]|nr:T9SS type A sorting domain-containing protein [Bacteroidota bacterium]